MRPKFGRRATHALIAFGVGAGALLLQLPVSPPVQAVATDTAVAYQMDPAHGGDQPNDPIAPPLSKWWSVDLGGTVSYPLVAQGMVYVVVAENWLVNGSRLYAIDQASGHVIWRSIELGGNSYWAAATYEGGRVFVVNATNQLRAFDASNGSLVWSLQLPGQAWSSTPPTAFNGVVYGVGYGSGGTVYAVRESDGGILWQKTVSSGDQSSPAVSATGVYVSYVCDHVYDFAPSNGALLWSKAGSCIGGGGRTSVLYNGRLYVRDPLNPASNPIYDAQNGTGLGTYAAVPAPAFDGSIGFFLNGTTLEARNLSSMAQIWSFNGDGWWSSAPIVVNGYVYAGSTSGNLYALAVATGSLAWSANLGAPIRAPDEHNLSNPLAGIAAGQGMLAVPAGTALTGFGAGAAPSPSISPLPTPAPGPYPLPISDGDQAVTYQNDVAHTGLQQAYDAKTGALLWSKQVPDRSGVTTCGCFASAPTAARGIVYTSGGGVAQVSALSEATGAVLWQQDVMGSDHSSPAVSPDGVYVTYACNQSYDFNPTTGAQMWHYQTPCTGGGGKTPVLNGGKLYARDEPLAPNPIIDSETGQRVGQFVSAVAPVIDGSVGLFFTGYTTLQAKDMSTNQVLWTFTEDRPLTAPVVVNGFVYVG